MDKQVVEVLVEEYLNNKRVDLPIDFDSGTSSREQFEFHTLKRLKMAYELYMANKRYQNDFMLALREYLLVFETNIMVSNINIPAENPFAIKKDAETGKYFATFQFPPYVNQAFVEQAFLKGLHTTKRNSKSYDLHTDPLIFSLTGFSKFKSLDQKLAVYGALNTPDGFTTLVSLPTGGGKSLITQTLSYQKEGLTIIIVPTVSLAIDQVRVAKKIIKTHSVENEIFSYSSGVDAAPILKAIKSKSARMLFISPEALLNNQGFSHVIKEANSKRYLKNIVIDEAHIVVDWGASFRVDYQCLESWRAKLLLTNPSIRTILLSATYERRCIEILKGFFSEAEKWIEIRCDSLRHEPRYILVKAKSNTDKNKMMIELVQKLPHPMIIYVARPVDAEDIKDLLQANGIENVRTFTGLTSASKRKELIDSWVDDQFEVMVATSAFGVGVDKSDVRTVLHMYIPQNPNTYYQELGRGGRDKLPCLSVMCIHPEDINISFQRISQKVMTTEKIIGRWNSMYNSKSSQRMDNLIYIDTSVKPNYSVSDAFDDSPTSDADMNWNIYVILLLRRYNLIRIREVLPQSDKYIFVIEIVDGGLRNTDENQFSIIDKARTVEWNYYNEAFQSVKKAIKNYRNVCWSEMFYETYDKISEYCAGCTAHTEPDESDFYEFPLKVSVNNPIKILASDQMALFGGAKELIAIVPANKKISVLDALCDKRLSVLVNPDDTNIDNLLSNASHPRNLFVIDNNQLRELIKKSSYYYVSGMVAVIYNGNQKEIYEQFKLVSKYLSGKTEIKIIHILEENTFFDELSKSFSDMIDGPVVPTDKLCY